MQQIDMFEFHYTALSVSSERVAGAITAATRGDALRLLTEKALTPITLRQNVKQIMACGRVRSSVLASAYVMLADQLETGVPLLNALQVLEQQSDTSSFRFSMNEVSEQVANGTSLADAMEQQPHVYGSLETSVIRAGEEGAFLPEALRRIASVRERNEATKSRIVGALAYPALLVVVGGIVITGMLTLFVPKFEPLFDSLQKADVMPLPTTVLLGVSGLLQSYGLWVAASVAVAAFLSRKAVSGPAGRCLMDRTLLRMWLVGPVVRDFAISRFCRVLGSLLQNGVPMLRSLEISRAAASNYILSESIGSAAESVASGKSLAAPLAASGQFSGDVVQMLQVAEQSNRLESVLLSIAERLDVRAQRRLDLVVKMLEPALMLVMAIIVGFLVVALLMPVFESNGLV
jgi:general secretion pathway protein F/type IV pilus assembly protein PilC